MISCCCVEELLRFNQETKSLQKEVKEEIDKTKVRKKEVQGIYKKYFKIY